MIRLICFLGNTGAQYARTRHNLGWMLLDYLPMARGAVWQGKFKGEYAQVGIPGKGQYILLKPHTQMNRVGESLSPALQFFKIDPSQVLVVHDDLELPFGTAGGRLGGGLAGHNGLRSSKQHLGTPDFFRYRLGIGRPVHGSVSSWVLGKFTPHEQALLPDYLDGAARLFEDLVLASEGFPKNQLKKTIVIP